MRKTLLLFLTLALPVLAVAVAGDARANPIYDKTWGLHYAGPHNSQGNDCGFSIQNCNDTPWGDVSVNAPSGPGRYDVYVLGLNLTTSVKSTKYGLCCEGPFYFYGWTSCSDVQTPTSGWPGSDEGIYQSWYFAQTDPHLTMGILDVFVYAGTSEMCTCEHPSYGYAEWCDGSSNCNQLTHPGMFGCVGFGKDGYNPCTGTPLDKSTWGRLKSLYR